MIDSNSRLDEGKELVDDGCVSVKDMLEMTRSLSREDKAMLFEGLGTQIAEDLAPSEVLDIQTAIAEGDAEYARGEGIPAAQFFGELDR